MRPSARWIFAGACQLVASFAFASSLPAPTPNILTPKTPTAITIDPTGHYAYIVNLAVGYGDKPDGTVSQYRIAANGVLTPMTPVSVSAGYDPEAIAIDAAGDYVYVASSSLHQGAVFQYAIGADGVLEPMAPRSVAAGKGPLDIVFDPVGRHVYVANYESAALSQYSVGPKGNLIPLAPATVPAGKWPRAIAVDPKGRYVYVADYLSPGVGSKIHQYAIDAKGRLTPLHPATVSGGPGVRDIAIDRTGRFVYAINCDSSDKHCAIAQFKVTTDGTLKATNSSTVPVGPAAHSLTIGPAGRHLYVARMGYHRVSQYSIGSRGRLTALTPASIPAGTGPTSVTVNPTGRYAYVPTTLPSSDNVILQYSIATDGSLHPLGLKHTAAPTHNRSLSQITGLPTAVVKDYLRREWGPTPPSTISFYSADINRDGSNDLFVFDQGGMGQRGCCGVVYMCKNRGTKKHACRHNDYCYAGWADIGILHEVRKHLHCETGATHKIWLN